LRQLQKGSQHIEIVAKGLIFGVSSNGETPVMNSS
jgi:hypothetical protein